jgi:hypothetical protein
MELEPIVLTARRASFAALVLCAGCLPTFQSPRIDPGWHWRAEAMGLSGKRVDSYTGGKDFMVTIDPAYGFGHRFELGIPFGVYGNQGSTAYPAIMPYAKLALDDPTQPTRIALVAQFPGSIGAVVAHDLGRWEPHASVCLISSAGGQDSDLAFYSRYGQDDQSLVAATIGTTLNTPERPAIEIGLLRNSYSYRGPQLHYDLFLRLKIGP